MEDGNLYMEIIPIPLGGSALFLGTYMIYWWWLFIGVIPSLLLELPMVAFRGQSLGKVMTHIKVVRFSDRSVPGPWRSTVRWIALYGPLAVPVIGWAVMLLAAIRARHDPHGRGLHDRIAGTIVLHIKGAEVRDVLR